MYINSIYKKRDRQREIKIQCLIAYNIISFIYNKYANKYMCVLTECVLCECIHIKSEKICVFSKKKKEREREKY